MLRTNKQTAHYELFTEYEKKGYDDMAKKKCLTPEQKAEIIKLREEGVRVSEIAERFDVIENTIYTVLKKYKEHEEQIADEIHDKDVNDAADDDYVCCEVTGDTDIDAYMSDRKVEEPAPAATEASSKQENCTEVPADIIPQKAQIVKPVPYGVREACRVRLDYLKDLIAEEQAIIDNWNAEMKEIIEFLEENKKGYADEV